MNIRSWLLRYYEPIALLIGVAWFLALACYQLDLPGPHYDEAIEVLPAMQLLLGQPVESFRGAGVRLGPWFLPLMVMDYIGAMNTYLVMPFFALLGINVIAMRVMPIGFGLGTLLLTYFFAREFFGRTAALIAFFTLAGNVSFVFWSRQGIFVTNLTSTILMGALWCGLRWWRSRRPGYLYATAFLLGLGLYTKLIFLWAMVAMAGAMMLVRLDHLVAWMRQRVRLVWPAGAPLGLHQMPGMLVAFLVPLIPLIVFNVQTGGTLSTLSKSALLSYYGVNNLAFGSNLLTRLGQFQAVLEGRHFWYLGETYRNALWPPALGISLALVILLGIYRRRTASRDWRKTLFTFAMLALILLQSCVTISALWLTHYALVMPLPPIALAGALTFAAGTLSPLTRRVLGKVLAIVAVVLALMGGDLITDIRYHHVLAMSGGYAAHSDASYRLAKALEQAEGPVVALDWGIQAPVQFLTRGRVVPREIFGYDSLAAPDASFPERLSSYLMDPRTIYVFHPHEQEVYQGRAQAFTESVERAGKVAHVKAVIYERSGRPAYVLVTVE